MLKMTVKPRRESSFQLGVGTYYLRPERFDEEPATGWTTVCFARPLILAPRHARLLIKSYGTQSADQMAAMAGAWSLRRDLLQRGYDGIVALGPPGKETHCAVVDLNRAGDRQHIVPASANGGTGAAISRLPSTAFAGRS